MDMQQSKWVDRYLLRYGPATVLGAFILAYLYYKRKELGFSFSVHLDRLSLGAIFLFGGFLFAYLASAPVLVYHYARALYSKKANKVRGAKWSVATTVVGAAASFFWLRSDGVEPFLASFAALAIGAWLSVVRLAMAAYYSREEIRRFYVELEDGRRELPAELVESYRTLREHGNAFQTMFWEILLALVIFAVLSVTTVEDDVAVFGIGLLTCLLWVYPAAVAWHVATQLEIDLTVEKPTVAASVATVPPLNRSEAVVKVDSMTTRN